jgi:hypothetical protein
VFKPPRDIIEWWPKYRQEKENEAHDIEATGQYSLSQWVNKSMAAAARLALLFYCVQRIQDGGTWIGDDGRWYDAMTLAIRWVDFLRPHAQRCFMTGLDTAVAQAMDGMLQRHSASLSAGKQMTAPQLMRGMSDKIRREYGDVAIDYAVALGRLRPAGGKGKRQYALGIG